MTADNALQFFVAGEPQQKGSMKAFVRNGRPVLTSTNKNLKQWELRIAHEAQRAIEMHKDGWPLSPDEGYRVSAIFLFTRPKSYPKSYEYANTKRPDLDKLLRAVLDGLTDIVLYDDAQVDKIGTLRKGYAKEGEHPGASVMIEKHAGRWPR